MSEKATLIASICEINPSASTEWLARFSETDLREYLNHLQVIEVFPQIGLGEPICGNTSITCRSRWSPLRSRAGCVGMIVRRW